MRDATSTSNLTDELLAAADADPKGPLAYLLRRAAARVAAWENLADRLAPGAGDALARVEERLDLPVPVVPWGGSSEDYRGSAAAMRAKWEAEGARPPPHRTKDDPVGDLWRDAHGLIGDCDEE